MECFDPKKKSRTITIGDKEYHTNDKYYLKNYLDWDIQVRDWFASKENLKPGPEHNCAIEFIRSDFERTNVHPVVRAVTAERKT